MVEIYFEKELSDIVFEPQSLDEWKSITEELGIKGQIELAEGTKSPIPYPYMNNKMKLVASTLCPTKIDLKEYSKTTIPLEVLRQAKFAIEEKHFGKIQVWYDDKSPDPFLIGIVGEWQGDIRNNSSTTMKIIDAAGNKTFKNKEDLDKAADELRIAYPDYKGISSWFYEKEYYLLARWGDHLRDFKELTQMAIDRVIDENSKSLTAEIAKLQEKLKLIRENAPLYIDGILSKHEFSGSW